mmetsp:Transcript_11377/g.11387  ORF Transcript_11377/g.11387 Transcript_11377/m.11387 type:complete len:150 (+) Transcript_11377:230-679(+)
MFKDVFHVEIATSIQEVTRQETQPDLEQPQDLLFKMLLDGSTDSSSSPKKGDEKSKGSKGKNLGPVIYKTEKLLYNIQQGQAMAATSKQYAFPAHKCKKLLAITDNGQFDQTKYLLINGKDNIIQVLAPDSLNLIKSIYVKNELILSAE